MSFPGVTEGRFYPPYGSQAMAYNPATARRTTDELERIIWELEGTISSMQADGAAQQRYVMQLEADIERTVAARVRSIIGRALAPKNREIGSLRAELDKTKRELNEAVSGVRSLEEATMSWKTVAEAAVANERKALEAAAREKERNRILGEYLAAVTLPE
jgi:carbamoylphosphate synthase small subunit